MKGASQVPTRHESARRRSAWFVIAAAWCVVAAACGGPTFRVTRLTSTHVVSVSPADAHASSVHDGLSSRKADVDSCFANALENDVLARGWLIVRWRIDADGEVASVERLQPTISEELDACVMAVVQTSRYSALRGRVTSVVARYGFRGVRLWPAQRDGAE
jgi:hypothetical protein